MEDVFSFRDKVFNVDFEDRNDTGRNILINDSESEISIHSQDENEILMTLNGERIKAYSAAEKDDYFVFINGRQYMLKKHAAGADLSGGLPGSAGGDFVSSPMPGTIIKINCSEGDEIKENDTLVIVEAMKMENMLRSPVDGKVEKISFSEGDLVDAGAPIVEIGTE